MGKTAATQHRARPRTRSSLLAEAAFRARLTDLGATLLEAGWLGGHVPHRVMCAHGHQCSPTPSSVNAGRGVCKRCGAAGASLAERFWAKVQKTDGCWLWAGSTAQGYGTLKIPGVRVPQRANRISYELHHGPIPEGFEVLHSCDNPPCVNPAHLSVGTHAKNMQECVERGRHSNGNHLKTHCPEDHPYDALNTYVAPNGSRKCRTCRRAANERCQARKRARAA